MREISEPHTIPEMIKGGALENDAMMLLEAKVQILTDSADFSSQIGRYNGKFFLSNSKGGVIFIDSEDGSAHYALPAREKPHYFNGYLIWPIALSEEAELVISEIRNAHY